MSAELRVLMGDRTLRGVGLEPLRSGVFWDWSETNNPSVPQSVADLTRDYDGTENVRPIVDGSVDEFWQRLDETIALVNGSTTRVVVEGEGMHQIKEFRKIGNGTDPTYAFGVWNRRLRGFLGHNMTVQLNPNSIKENQLAYMSQMPQSTYAPLQMGVIRLDATPASPYRISGVTFQAADQPLLTSVNEDFSPKVYTPTPAPHGGLVPYSDTTLAGSMSYTRFLGFGRALNSRPPFECANIHSGKGYQDWHHLDIDGRRAASLDPLRPRRSGSLLVNSEWENRLRYSWVHDTALSRYAANDQNNSIAGLYAGEYSKFERITEQRNVDPNMNGGQSLGGWTDASNLGYESSNARVEWDHTIFTVENPNPTNGQGQIPTHHQFTTPGGTARNPQGGRARFIDCIYRHLAHPHLDGYATFRIAESTYWWLDGFNTTINVTNGGVRKAPLVVPKTINWPPSAAWLASQGATPNTHYLIRPA